LPKCVDGGRSGRAPFQAAEPFGSLRTFTTFDDQPSPVSVAFAAALE